MSTDHAEIVICGIALFLIIMGLGGLGVMMYAATHCGCP